MSIATTCPECNALFRLAEKLEGKRVRCLKCQATFIVPSAGVKETQAGLSVAQKEDADDESADDDRSESVAERPRLPAPKSKREEEVDEPEESDDERSDADDEDEEFERRPRPIKKKRKKKKSGQGSLTLMIVIGGAALVLCLVCGGVGTIGYFVATRPDGGPAFAQDALPAPVNGAIPIALGPNGGFRANTALTNRDALKDGRHTKTFSIRLDAGKTYEIDMTSDDIDCYLFVLDETGRVVAEDDDGGELLDSRIVFTPQRTGTYRIDATSFDFRERGSFTLSVKLF